MMIDKFKYLTRKTFFSFKGKKYSHYRYYSKYDSYVASKLNGIWDVNFLQRHHQFDGIERLVLTDRVVHIILSGPSLQDIENKPKLLNSFSIVVNGSHACFESNEPIFDLYLLSDIGFVLREWERFKEGLKKSKSLAVDHRVLMEILRKDASVLNGIRVYLFDNLKRPYGRPTDYFERRESSTYFTDNKSVSFSVDPEYGFYPSNTVAYVALQVAASGSPSKIVFFGLDLGGERFYKEENPEKSMIDKDYDQYILPHFTFSSNVLNRLNIPVFNASPGSRLPESVFPKTDPNRYLEAMEVTDLK